MYYENKRTFYIKQYGPAAVILLIALVLIGTGIYLAVKPDSNNLQANNTDKTPTDVITTNQYTLSDQAYEGKVVAVDGLSIKVEANGTVNEVSLIGIKQNKERLFR